MPVKTRWLTAAALVGVAAVGAVILFWPSDEADPQAYPGSVSGYSIDDAQRLSRVRLPECARAGTRYFVDPEWEQNVTFDFAGTADCVASFLSGLGEDSEHPDSVWPGTSGQPIRPPEGSAIPWVFATGTPVDTWYTVLPGNYREQVEIAVDRTTPTPHVYIRAIDLD
ncbi:hypothetical protein [Actinokineospora sp. NBRC 105648]|uniref:hypothetical protein n=1 Tax=Actinokineospora sp. NBRC 105648 TaxID=3032206 RepID=UPI00249FA47F|nr:hypothetical protein [Actinokineospora sp. NBRC 105648]GLZ38151.1 hypothetical protein Acsp05_17750 [Actinokineospora sp. NBRC 105648]